MIPKRALGRCINLIILLFLLCGLSSCGFHLRGPTRLASPLLNLYIKSHDPYGQLALNLAQSLQASGVNLVNSPQCATTILEILCEKTEEKLLSVGGTQQTRQYKLILTVTFQITDRNGCLLYGPESLSESSTIPISSNQVLGGSNEASNLYQRMRQSIIYDIMLRLSSQCATVAVMKAS